MDKDVPAGASRVLIIGDPAALEPRSFPIDAAGMLIVLVSDRDRADAARRAFADAISRGHTTVINAEPSRMLHKLSGPFDLVVLDRTHLALRSSLDRLLAPGGRIIPARAEGAERAGEEA